MQKMAGAFKEEDLTEDMIDLDFWFTDSNRTLY
jgi:hypothetical protein